jgi:hypothetical protein
MMRPWSTRSPRLAARIELIKGEAETKVADRRPIDEPTWKWTT